MNPQLLEDDRDSGRVEPGEGVGRRLRAARIDRGLDLDRIAAQLHLRSCLVEALEVGRYEALPGPVFVAGYIRNYARQVGLDPEPLVAAYAAAQGQAEPTRVLAQPRATPRGHGASAFLIRVMTVVLVAGVAYLFVQWWQNRAPTVSELAGEPIAALDSQGPDPALGRAPPAAEEPPPAHAEGPGPVRGVAAERNDAVPPHRVATPVAAPPVAETQTPPPAPAPTPIASSAEPAPDADAPAVAGEPEGSAPPGADQVAGDEGDVVLEFRGPCWVDVRDSTKSFSLTGEMSKGDRRVLGGTPPYSLILGNTTAVTVSVKGAPFDLTRVSKGNVARFKLDPAALP